MDPAEAAGAPAHQGLAARVELIRRLPTFMWAMPCYGPIYPKVYRTHMAAISSVGGLGLKIYPRYVGVTDKMSLVDASNLLVKMAQQLRVDYVLWTEMDMLLPVDAIPRLYDQQKDICCGLYFLRGSNDKPQPCVYRKIDGPGVVDEGFVQMTVIQKHRMYRVGAAGMGCALIKTSVFDRLSQPPFEQRTGGPGQDMSFYGKCWRAGVEVWVNTDVLCGQANEPQEISWDDYEAALQRRGSTFSSGLIDLAPPEPVEVGNGRH